MGRLRRKLIRKATKYAFKAVKKGSGELVSEQFRKTVGKGINSSEKGDPGFGPRAIGSITLRSMRESDRTEVLEMMREFYSSGETATNGSDAIFTNDINECLSDSPFLEGFVFAYKDSDSSLWGYAMIAHSFSTEFGKPSIRIEELYLREEARGLGLEEGFRKSLEETYPDSLLSVSNC